MSDPLLDEATRLAGVFSGTSMDRTLRALVERVQAAEARAYSLAHTVNPGSTSPRTTWPNDDEANEAIRDAETLVEAIWEIGEKYDVPLTNNMPRWQDGQFLREAGEFIHDVVTAADRFNEARGKLDKVRAAASRYLNECDQSEVLASDVLAILDGDNGR